MEAFNLITKLRQNANDITNLFKECIPRWENNRQHYDKCDAKFNEDPRFRACDSISIYFSSWQGTFGNSSCSTAIHLDANIFNKHLVNYLNRHKKEIMLEIAETINIEAFTHKEKATQELQEKIKLLSQLENI